MPLPEASQRDWRRETRAVRGGSQRSEFGEISEALFLTSGYAYSGAEEAEAAFKDEIDRYIYSRFANPTVQMFQDRMSLIEGAEDCRATATGMAAVFASLACQVNAGDRVVGSRALFGSCLYVLTEILPRFGVETVIIDGGDLDQWADALKTPAKCVFLETPSNPGLNIVDIAAVAEMSHRAGAKLVIDNVFATPILQRPMEFGADIVVYSATKHIDGQGRCLGGAILADAEFCANTLQPFLRHTGPALSPFNAWVLLKGLETLEIRMAQLCANTRIVVDDMIGRNRIVRVVYPGLESHPGHDLAKRQMSGFGNVITFDVEGGKEGAFRFLNALRLIDISNNLGDTKSLITHPATTTHQRLRPEERAGLGIFDETVRLSVGLESTIDVIEDIAQALAAAK